MASKPFCFCRLRSRLQSTCDWTQTCARMRGTEGKPREHCFDACGPVMDLLPCVSIIAYHCMPCALHMLAESKQRFSAALALLSIEIVDLTKQSMAIHMCLPLAKCKVLHFVRHAEVRPSACASRTQNLAHESSTALSVDSLHEVRILDVVIQPQLRRV